MKRAPWQEGISLSWLLLLLLLTTGTSDFGLLRISKKTVGDGGIPAKAMLMLLFRHISLDPFV